MNNCPYKNARDTCGLQALTVPAGKPTTAYCSECSEVVFRCTSGHWNRAFARYCTQCSQKLIKPAQWSMASANAQRTALLPNISSVDSLSQKHGFILKAANTPEVGTEKDIPGLLAFDGLIVIPNFETNTLDAYTIAKPTQQKNLSLKWSAPVDERLTYGTTPIYHGVHLFYVVPGKILRKPVTDGEASLVALDNVDPANICPVPKCAPLKCRVNGKQTMVVGLEQGMLMLNLTNNDAYYIQHKFFSENTVLGPTQCGDYIVFTTLEGQIFSLNTSSTPYSLQVKKIKGISFSAPISIGESVYFEELRADGNRGLTRFEPSSGRLSKATSLDSDRNRYDLFTNPPLTDGNRIFMSDRYGKHIYIHETTDGYSFIRDLPQKDNRYLFAPHLSIVANNRIYSATSYGLTILEIGKDSPPRYQSLSMGFTNTPVPVTRPIRYGNKLFIFCKEQLICLDC